MSAGAVIELDAATVARDSQSAPLLSEVTWRIAEGEFWVITGAHGSGKSVLLETMAGVRPCVAGDLRWFGQPITAADLASGAGGALRRRIGLVFEGGGRVFGHLSVAENIALPVSYHEGCRMETAVEHTADLRAALELEPFSGVLAARMGRAWMQRVALGRALALAPEVLLLDNPLAGLDPGQVAWWRAFLDRLSEGHPAAGGRRMTLVVSADDARPWRGVPRRYGEVRDRRWCPAPSDGPDGAGD